MGIDFELISIAPQRYHDLSEILSQANTLEEFIAIEKQWVGTRYKLNESYLRHYELHPTLMDDQKQVVFLRNKLLEQLCEDHRWNLGRRFLNLTFDIECLTQSEAFNVSTWWGRGIEIQKNILQKDGFGLMHIWTWEFLVPCMEVINHYARKEQVEAFIPIEKPHGKEIDQYKYSEQWIQHWKIWELLSDAIRDVIQHKKLLGMIQY